MSIIKLADCQHSIEASDANFTNSRFDDVSLADSLFKEVTLASSRFEGVYMDGCRFERVSLAGASITDGVYDGMTIEGISVTALLACYEAAHAATQG